MKMYFVRTGTTVQVTDHCPVPETKRDSIVLTSRVANSRSLRIIHLDATHFPPMKENTVYTIDF